MTDPRQMIGLMSRWFAAPAGLPLEGGYFYLCPNCFEELIQPHLEELLDLLREHQPAPKSATQPPAGDGAADAPDAAAAPAAAAAPPVAPSSTPPESTPATNPPANGRRKRAPAPKEPPPASHDTPAEPEAPSA